ncbi:hypothetical protein EGR_10798 [Echinococcus granulosus]|uniref:Uncharacterized protein n=1 Tax=Echinococcus granulosus TaxID=6210 RepID=W6ULE0_ECHGR|nr:hypothetical protein EGR_10798 [Echinococcus granulosus]EUB54344.1 hypothetical protein EGR_10798 [Echinococcus granulosus]
MVAASPIEAPLTTAMSKYAQGSIYLGMEVDSRSGSDPAMSQATHHPSSVERRLLVPTQCLRVQGMISDSQCDVP